MSETSVALPPSPDERSGSSTAIARYLTEHAALVLSATLIVLSLVHVLAVARFDLATAEVLLAVANRVHILLATAASLFLAIVLGALVNPISRKRLMRGLTWGASSIAEIITLSVMWLGFSIALSLLSPVSTAVVVLVTCMYFWHRRVARRTRRVTEDGRIVLKRRDTALWVKYLQNALLVLLAIVFLSTPWMPRERVVYGNGQVQIGYIIGEQGGQTLILTNDRRATWLRTSDIEDRRVCGPSRSGWWVTPFRRIVDGGYERCSE